MIIEIYQLIRIHCILYIILSHIIIIIIHYIKKKFLFYFPRVVPTNVTFPQYNIQIYLIQ